MLAEAPGKSVIKGCTQPTHPGHEGRCCPLPPPHNHYHTLCRVTLPCVIAAATVIDAIKAGELRHIFLVGGCDAGEPSR